VPVKVKVVSQLGEREATKEVHLAKYVRPEGVHVQRRLRGERPVRVIADFGAGNSVTLSRVGLLVRQDSFGTGRSGNLHLEGSNDLTTWTPITGNASPTLASQNMLMSGSPVAYRYLKVANTDWINIAELCLFG
jgi:hypothetical protein